MAEYIRKSQLLRALDSEQESSVGPENTYAGGLAAAIEIVEEGVGIERLQIVRCYECKWWDRARNNRGACFSPRDDLNAAKTGKGYCVHRGGTSANDFCSKGAAGKWENRYKPEEVTDHQS